MVKIQVNSQGKAYLTTGGKALVASGGGDTISAINNTGASVSSGDKVFIAPLATPQSGANYELVKAETATMYGFYTQENSTIIINNSDKSVSNFSAYSSCLVNKIMNYTQQWEFNICFETGSNISGQQYLYFANNDDYNASGLILHLIDNKIQVYMRSATSTVIADILNYGVSSNTVYYVKIGWTGTQYYVKYSIDGTTWTEDVDSPITSNAQVKQTSGGIELGARSSRGLPFYGKIYMDKTYLTSGDSIQWLMYSDGLCNIGSDILTGIASANIASGAVGNVSTILGE